ncbi:hypothetical protein ABZ754_24350 [Micromonospora purpureochromogenes]|uniref:hypothetical protein n=1 Tax=Micromonospora purpureochromogenes TaxID=47872 RepID=UPI0033E72BC4
MSDREPTDGSPPPGPAAPAARDELRTLFVLLLASAVLLALSFGCAAFWLYN